MPTCPARARRGLTIIELMVVIVLLGVIAAMMAPTLGGTLNRMQAEAAAHQIADLANYCFSQATATGRVFVLAISSDGRRLQVLTEPPRDPLGPLWAPAAGMPEDEQAVGIESLQRAPMPGWIDRTLPETVVVSESTTFDEALSTSSEGNVQLFFFPDGTSEFATLRVENIDGDVYQVLLDGLSGAVYVVPYDASNAAQQQEGTA